MSNVLDIIGKRFLGYLVTLAGGFFAARLITDGVQLEHFYNFATILFGAYVAGQTTTDGIAFLKGLRTLIK